MIPADQRQHDNATPDDEWCCASCQCFAYYHDDDGVCHGCDYCRGLTEGDE